TYYQSDLTMNSVDLVPGEWYYISVDNRAGTSYRGSFTLCLDATVDYDYKMGAIKLPEVNSWTSANGAYSTLWATPDEDAGGCWVNGPNYNRWFQVRATSTDLKIDVKTGGSQGSAQYLMAALWDEAGNELSCARYTYYQSDLSFSYTNLTPGEWYYITVDNRAGDSYRGSFTLAFTDQLDYDYKEGAIELTDFDNWESPGAAFSTLYATPDELKGSCWLNGPNYNRWFKFQAISPNIEINLKTGGSEGSMQYPMMALWDDSNNELACAVYTYYNSDIQITYNSLTPGAWYYITVDNRAGDNYRGSFTLGVNDWNRVWNGLFSTDWDDNSNWNVGSPNEQDNVLIPANTNFDPVISHPSACYNMSLAPGASLTVESSASLDVDGDLTIKSDATGTCSIVEYDNLNVAGSTLYQKYYTGSDWHYISSPVENAVSGMYLENYLMWYDEPNGAWEYITPVNFPLTPGQGFAVWSPLSFDNTASYSGSLNSGNVSIGYTNSGPPIEGNGWNLLGNPYPSSIDWDEMTLPSTLDGAMYVWDPVLDDYRYYLEGGSSNTTTQFLAPTQGFYVHCNDLAGGMLTFSNDVRTHSMQDFYKGMDSYEKSIVLEASGFETSKIGIRINENATEDYDADLDVYKLFGSNPEIPSLYMNSIAGELAINSIPEVTGTKVISIGLSIGTSGTYAIDFSGVQSFPRCYRIFWEDVVTGGFYRAHMLSSYTFEAESGNNPDRFRLHIINTSAPDNTKTSGIYSVGKKVYVQFAETTAQQQVSIYNLNGKELVNQKFSGEITGIIPTYLARGIYLVRVVNGNTVDQQKIFVE
ncbi:MAG: T9SS type A sorting domain-containing protein, partial [Bacteroidales bacterium]|nr:T9SS type A sorting domain-containing protein [Bacteroidales bacterium]